MKYLRLALVLSVVPHLLHGQAAVPAAKPGSIVFHYEELTATPNGVGERRDVTNGPTATFGRFESHMSVLLPGRFSHPPHQHPQEELIIQRQGALDVTINGVTTHAGPGSLLFFASNDFHNVKSVGDVPAMYAVFNFTTAATASAPKQGAAAVAVPGRLGSSVFDWAKLAVKTTATGERRDVADSPTTTLANFECHVTTLKPHEAPHAPHHHPDEEIVLVKEGTLDVVINGTKIQAGPGAVIFAASNEEHGWHNAGDTTATYYVMRIVTGATPKPAAK
jgi:quercetin dioxygenase-like cupin family protein